MAEWNFFVFIDSNDRDVVSDWLDVLPLKASAKIRQILWNQRLFAVWEKRFCKSLKGHKGLYELRISRQRAQFRLLGFFGTGSGEFTIVDGTQKTDKIPQGVLERAMQRIEIVRKDERRRREFQIY